MVTSPDFSYALLELGPATMARFTQLADATKLLVDHIDAKLGQILVMLEEGTAKVEVEGVVDVVLVDPLLHVPMSYTETLGIPTLNVAFLASVIDVNVVESVPLEAEVTFPSDQEVTVSNFPTHIEVSNFPSSVEVSNIPAEIDVGNFPSGFEVTNFPSVTEITGSVDMKVDGLTPWYHVIEDVSEDYALIGSTMEVSLPGGGGSYPFKPVTGAIAPSTHTENTHVVADFANFQPVRTTSLTDWSYVTANSVSGDYVQLDVNTGG